MMKHPEYNSPTELKNFLESRNMAMQKKFGQNFLVNGDARKLIIDTLQIKPGTKIWEIGPGLGAMTYEILQTGAELTVFEIDHGFAAAITEFFADYKEQGKFKLVEGDVLKTWKKELQENGKPDYFFGNLPYNIAASLVGDTIEHGVRFDKMLITVQKEVAQRIAAQAGSKDCSSFSVLCQWAYNVKPVVTLSGGNFWPKPNVDSRAVLLTPKQEFPGCSDPLVFAKMQRALFSARRKTIKNNLTNFLGSSEKAAEAIALAGLAENVRAEALKLEQLLKLSDEVCKVK